MLVRVRRKQGGARLSAQLPVNAMSRRAVDAEVERLRHSVVPIIRSKGGRPFLEGSTVAISYRGRKCLATAFHVLKHNDGRQLMYFAADGYVRPLGGTFEVSEKHDIAVALLDDADIAALSHIPFLTEDQIGSAAGGDGRFYASVTGYPHTASKLMDRQTLDTRMEVYSAAARETVGGFLSVHFDKKLGAWGANGHVYVRDPKGKSGGAIFGMPLLGLNSVQPSAQAKLVGIPTLWRGKEIIGASAAMLIPLLEAVTQDH